MKNSPEKLTGFLANQFAPLCFVVGGVGLFASLIMYTQNPKHFFFSYLTVFCFFLTISLGGFFFVLIQFLTRAGWGVVVRRIAEHQMKNLWVMALLFIPILLGVFQLYHWTHHDAVAHDAILKVKSPYLNLPFFLIRAALFFGIWMFLSQLFFKKSTKQDETGDEKTTLLLQGVSAVGVLLFALSLTFAFVDWVMSLTPHWYSTMIGVYFFAGSCVSGIATISFIAMVLRRFGFLRDKITVEHYHDLGKLLYGFNIFWSYIAFSQYFLIWYANIPEETIWFKMHFMGSWNWVAAALAIGHFGIPFVLFMSRHIKRNLTTHFMMLVWILGIHFIDMYWMIMPNITPNGFSPSLIDLTCFIGIGGIYFGALFSRMKRHSLVACGDPRLEESLHFKNA